MKILTKTALVAVSIAALGCMSTAVHAAGTAVALPAADTIYQGNYDEDPAALWTTAADGTATVIGTPATSGMSDSTDGAWNPATGASYVIANGYDGPCELWSADVTSGQFALIAEITATDGPTSGCDAFDIAPDGTAWVTLHSGEQLAKLNLTDGTTSAAVEITGTDNGATWIVVHPTTGALYLSGWDNTLYTLDTSTGAATELSSANSEGSIYDAAFDSAGRLWLTAWPDNTSLLSADVSDFAGTLVFQGDILIDGSGDRTGTDSLWIARGQVAEPAAPVEPTLAEAGIAAEGVLVTGLAMLLLGLGVVTARRLHRA